MQRRTSQGRVDTGFTRGMMRVGVRVRIGVAGRVAASGMSVRGSKKRYDRPTCVCVREMRACA